jgi:hypothetical protein
MNVLVAAHGMNVSDEAAAPAGAGAAAPAASATARTMESAGAKALRWRGLSIGPTIAGYAPEKDRFLGDR